MFSPVFDKQNEDYQILGEIERYIDTKNMQNLTQNDIDHMTIDLNQRDKNEIRKWKTVAGDWIKLFQWQYISIKLVNWIVQIVINFH